ncbi:MAG: toprim domain-containing protein [Anaerolineales bacterium]|nr:toprim domain-containing protein [Anaerolineales bacterium]
MAVDIQEIKAANRLEDLVRLAGHELHGSGRYLKGREHDSFVVDTHNQSWHDNGSRLGWRTTQGDIVDWVMEWKRLGFRDAIEYLARHAGLPEPVWREDDPAAGIAARIQETALTVAARVFVHRLWRNDAAQAYARSRGWDDETIRAAGLGYTGSGTAEELAELRQAFANNQLDPEDPAAVAVLGYQGNLASWAGKHKIEELPANWREQGRVPGLPPGMLVYPHVEGGRVRYLSLRSIREKRHHNLSQLLVGTKRPYYNHAWSPREREVVIVEGQADALSLAQWGIPAVALAGASAADKLLGALSAYIHSGTVYLGLDMDQPGETAAGKLMQVLGPLARLAQWPAGDANEWLQAMASNQVAVNEQAEHARAVLREAPTVVEKLAEIAGGKQGAERDEALKQVMGTVAKLGAQDLALYRKNLAKKLRLDLREFNLLLDETKKVIETEGHGEDERYQEVVGGHFGGWLLELVYDPAKKKTLLAYRDPEGAIGKAPFVEIEGITYAPRPPDDLILQEVVVLPSGLGQGLSESELVRKIVDLLHRYYLIDPFYEQLIAYYVLFTYHSDSFRNLVYLRALGEWGSGKSQLMMIVGYLSHRLIKLTGAASEASIFRTLHLYKGSLWIDEADKVSSDTDDPFTKILNTGNQKGLPVVRMRDSGSGKYEPEAFDVFGPKLLTTRRRFDDEALESRCLTIETVKHSMGELLARGITGDLNQAFFEEAAGLRNELLLWRLRTWQPQREIERDLVDVQVQARLNQVMNPIKQIVSDPKVRDDITALTRGYQQRMVTEKSMTLESKVLQALIQIKNGPPVTKDKDGKALTAPYWDYSMGNVAKVANAIIDAENSDGETEQGESDTATGGKKLQPRGVGAIIKDRLILSTERATSGPLKRKYVVVWNEERIRGLCSEYGVEYEHD